MKFGKGFMYLVGFTVLAVLLSGCAVNFYKHSPKAKKEIKDLKGEISRLERLRMEEAEKFKTVKDMLEKKLKGQIGGDQVSLSMRDGGLVIILSDNILFDSGKAEVKQDAYGILDNVAAIINKEVPDKNIGVSGHTDNVPITYSNWKSNWELSTSRATNVLHYLEGAGMNPERLSATGYGEHRPIASNDTKEGRKKNRRVEIVILPQYTEKRELDSSAANIK